MSKARIGIQYGGVPGITQPCLDAIMQLIQYNEKITRARILSAYGEHGFLLTIDHGDLVAIKAGFGSGYSGEGSRKFSYVLQLLEAHKVEIDEYEVGAAMLNRLNNGALTDANIDAIDAMRPVRPQRYHDYIDERHYDWFQEGKLWKEFRPVVPFGIIDSRITDLAISFWDNPDDKLMVGYRRLEDTVRNRIGSNGHSSKLFSEAFLGRTPKLCWKDIEEGERNARASLFIGAFGAHRNPRAHKEAKGDPNAQLSEFLLLNHLYTLESEATA